MTYESPGEEEAAKQAQFEKDVSEVALSIINQHIPNLTDENGWEISDRIYEWGQINGDKVDIADFAIRTCSCGQRIDGFYEYIDHLKATFKELAS